MISKIRFRVFSLTFLEPLITLDTVDLETPAKAAISLIVIKHPPLMVKVFIYNA